VAGLLLNFEAVFTVGLAALLSGERVGGRGLRGIVLVIAGAVALSSGGALFALAPGFAALLSWVVLRESIHASALIALAGMTGGALLLATDVHEHIHTHEALEHSHEHEQDEHHQHGNSPEELARGPHAHWHRHEPMTHAHPHTHDTHHRHRH